MCLPALRLFLSTWLTGCCERAVDDGLDDGGGGGERPEVRDVALGEGSCHLHGRSDLGALLGTLHLVQHLQLRLTQGRWGRLACAGEAGPK